jgi:O-antigen/teichoic acid export membrane protein
MLIRQSALYIIARIVPGLVSMGLTAVLTRILVPASYGRYGLATLIMMIGASILFDWLGVALVRLYAGERKTNATLRTFWQIFLLLAGTLLAAAVPVSLAAGWAYLVGALLIVAYSGFELAARVQMASFRAGRYLAMNLLRSLLILVFAVPIAALTLDGLWAAAGSALGMAAAALVGRPITALRRPGGLDRALAREIAGYGFPIAVSMTLNGLINSGTRALVGGIGSTEELGYYTAAFVLIQNTLTMLGSGIEGAAFPLAVAAVERGDEAGARRQLVQNATLLLAVLAPAAIGMAVTAPAIAHNLVGASFETMAASLTPWMCAGGLFGNLRSNYLDHAFQLGQRPHLQVWVTAVAGLLAMALAALLIPGFGAVGAAIAVTVATAVSCLHALIAGRRAFRLPFPIGQAGRILAACMVMALIVELVPGITVLSLAAQIGSGAMAYGLAVFALDVLGARRRIFAWLTARRNSGGDRTA